jgi:hypothetical protein
MTQLLQRAWDLMLQEDLRQQWFDAVKSHSDFHALTNPLVDCIEAAQETLSFPLSKMEVQWREVDSNHDWVDESRCLNSNGSDIRSHADYDTVIAALTLPEDISMRLSTARLIAPLDGKKNKRIYSLLNAMALVESVSIAPLTRSCYTVIHATRSRQLLRLFGVDYLDLVIAVLHGELIGYRAACEARLKSIWIDTDELYDWLQQRLRDFCRRGPMTLSDASKLLKVNVAQARVYARSEIFQFVTSKGNSDLKVSGYTVEVAIESHLFMNREKVLGQYFSPVRHRIEYSQITGQQKMPLPSESLKSSL